MALGGHILAGFVLGFHHRRHLRHLLDSTSSHTCILELILNRSLRQGMLLWRWILMECWHIMAPRPHFPKLLRGLNAVKPFLAAT